MAQTQASPRVLRAVQSMGVLDSAESYRAAGQLTELIAGTYRLNLPSLASGMMFDVDNTPDPGLERLEVSRVDIVGGVSEGNRNGENSVDRVDVVETGDGRRVVRYTNVYGFSVDELERAARRGVPLSTTKAQAARYVHSQKTNSLVFEGAVGLTGLLNDPAIPVINAPKKLSAMTGDEVLEFMNDSILAATNQTYGRFVIDSISSTPTAISAVNTKLITGTGITAGSILFANGGSTIKNRYSAYEMTKDGADYMLVYAKNPLVGLVRNPLLFRQLPPQYAGTMMDIYCMSASGGLTIVEPGAYLLIKGV